MLSFAKFRQQNLTFFDTANHIPYFVPFLLYVREFFQRNFLLIPVFYLCFAIRTGVFLNDIKLIIKNN